MDSKAEAVFNFGFVCFMTGLAVGTVINWLFFWMAMR